MPSVLPVNALDDRGEFRVHDSVAIGCEVSSVGERRSVHVDVLAGVPADRRTTRDEHLRALAHVDAISASRGIRASHRADFDKLVANNGEGRYCIVPNYYRSS